VLNAQVVFLKDVGDINLERHKKTQAFLNFKGCISFETPELHRDVFIDGSQQSFDFSLHISCMVTVTQAMRSELVSKQSAIMLVLSIG
jgi:hypothetical protein